MPTISSGPRMVPTQNHRVRTRSMNSRRMTAKTLSMVRTLRLRRGGGRFGAHQIDENLVKRRLGQLEFRQSGPRRDQRFQDLLRIRVGRELELRGLRGSIRLFHQPRVREYPLGIAGGAVEPD